MNEELKKLADAIIPVIDFEWYMPTTYRFISYQIPEKNEVNDGF